MLETTVQYYGYYSPLLSWTQVRLVDRQHPHSNLGPCQVSLSDADFIGGSSSQIPRSWQTSHAAVSMYIPFVSNNSVKCSTVQNGTKDLATQAFSREWRQLHGGKGRSGASWTQVTWKQRNCHVIKDCYVWVFGFLQWHLHSFDCSLSHPITGKSVNYWWHVQIHTTQHWGTIGHNGCRDSVPWEDGFQ